MSEQTTALKPIDRIKSLAQTKGVKERFDQMLGKRSAAFVSSVISACSANPGLQKCEPMSIFSSAAVAASMDLPINPSLGLSHIVPYKGVAQFQIGWKGFVQLALRTGQYKTINATKIYEGQIKDVNPFTGEIELQKESTSDKVVGYLLYFRLVNGFEKYYYMSKEECEAHGKKYSASYKKNFGNWVDDFDAMALKTVVKMGLSKYGILSIDMQKAIEVDQASVDEEGQVSSYPDSTQEAEVEVIDEVPKEEKTKPSKLKKAVQQQAPAQEEEPPLPDSEESPI